jgi:hypothetical protein
MTSLRLRGSAFAEPLPRSGLNNPIVPLLRACITYKWMFLGLNRSCMEQIRHACRIFTFTPLDFSPKFFYIWV